MKSPDEIANHPKAVLHRELVERLRSAGSAMGAERAWTAFRLNPRLWRKIVTFGFDNHERQKQLTKIAFPDANWIEVEAALRAGNKLKPLYELACGIGSIARDAAGNYKVGSRGYKVVSVQPRSRGERR